MNTLTMMTAALAGLGAMSLSGAAQAQDFNSASGLRLPENIQLFGDTLPSVVKATAIVNGEIITQTDIDQRVALSLIGSDATIGEEDLRRLQQQALRNLIDETLQTQAAIAEEIELPQADIDRSVQRVAENANVSVPELLVLLEQSGSSKRSLDRQIRGELAWYRLQDKKIASGISVGDDEIDAVIEKMEANKGQVEYRVGEIFLSSTPATDDQVRANAEQIIELLRQGVDFRAIARQYSEASHAAVGGLLGWVRPEDLPAELGTALTNMEVGAVTIPIKIPGGYSIMTLSDKRTILAADPRDAVLSLKQVSIPMQADMPEAQIQALLDRFADAAAANQGCGGAERLASDFGGRVVSQDGIVIRDLPPALQAMMADMQIGQATRPFGAVDDAVSTLVICGREDARVNMPSRREIENQKVDERVAMRARRYLRDLRRDAIIDFR
ncbi:peptidylprolyl isomerase [Sphingomicrobium sp. XHP0239]|uniref:peptidylprolyl isomerase n=1 Tax=Sphingomicrobium maritimum TaxID=3133972 RepID=UPI0031CC5ACE